MLSGRNRPRGGVSRLLSKPLRRVVGRVRGGLERLECGHVQLEVSDIVGPTNAARRRCRACPDRDPAPVRQHTVEAWDEDEGAWTESFVGLPAAARERYDRLAYLGLRARVIGARGRVLRESPPGGGRRG